MASRSALPLVVGAFVCGLLVAWLAVHWFGRTPSGISDASAGRARAAADVAAGDRRDIADPRGFGTSPGASPAAATPADMEICGMPSLALNPAFSLDDDPRFAARIDAVNQRFIETLSTDADERVRAAAWLLRRAEDLRLTSRSDAAAIDALCGADTACVKAAVRRGPSDATLQSVLPATEALARMAATSADPAVYAAAIDACAVVAPSASPQGSACQLVSVGQWARIDPDNADAWLHVAGAAAERKDAAALDDALNHVAHAKGSRIYGNTLAALVDAAVPAGSDEFDAARMHMAAWKLFAEWSLPPLQTVMSYCAPTLLGDSNRRQTCDAVAHQLIDTGSTLIERGVGIRLGSRLGWPGETVVALHQEQDAMHRAQSQSLDGYDDVASCSAVAKARALVRQAGQLGEAGAARVTLAASGRSIAELAAEVDTERASTAAASQPATAASPARAASPP